MMILLVLAIAGGMFAVEQRWACAATAVEPEPPRVSSRER